MNLKSRYLVVALSALVVAGCGSSSKKELPPAELQKFNAEVELDRVWKRNIGNGQGDLYNNLTPAMDGLSRWIVMMVQSNGRLSSTSRCPVLWVQAVGALWSARSTVR